MALTQSQFDEIMREYERKRERSRLRAQQAKQTVRERIPEYRETEDKITDLAMKSADRVFAGDASAVAAMKTEMRKLSERQEELLLQNGFDAAYLEEKYECNDCRDTGYINGTEKCHCLKQAILRYTYRQSNIEEVLQRENFDTLTYDYYTDPERERMRSIIERCKSFADDFGNGCENILLQGSVGVGKTFLTNCMAKAVLDKGYSVIYFTSIRLFDTLSRGIFRYDDDESWDVQRDIYSCDLLIIDDLGTESVNSFVASRLFDILNERDTGRRSTIISTNLSFEELGGRYTERNFSRIFGNYTILHPDVEDIRIRKRRK